MNDPQLKYYLRKNPKFGISEADIQRLIAEEYDKSLDFVTNHAQAFLPELHGKIPQASEVLAGVTRQIRDSVKCELQVHAIPVMSNDDPAIEHTQASHGFVRWLSTPDFSGAMKYE